MQLPSSQLKPVHKQPQRRCRGRDGGGLRGGDGGLLMNRNGGGGEKAPGRNQCTFIDLRFLEGEALTPLPTPRRGQRLAALRRCPARSPLLPAGTASHFTGRHLVPPFLPSHTRLPSLTSTGNLSFTKINFGVGSFLIRIYPYCFHLPSNETLLNLLDDT